MKSQSEYIIKNILPDILIIMHDMKHKINNLILSFFIIIIYLNILNTKLDNTNPIINPYVRVIPEVKPE